MSTDGSYPRVAFPIDIHQHPICCVQPSNTQLTFSIRGPAHIHDMNKSIGVTQIVQELVT